MQKSVKISLICKKPLGFLWVGEGGVWFIKIVYRKVTTDNKNVQNVSKEMKF